MSNSAPAAEGGHRSKRLKLNAPKGSSEGTARFRMSAEGLIEEPVGSRGPPRKSGSLGAARGKTVKVIQNTPTPSATSNSNAVVQNMLANVFSPTTDKPASSSIPPVNGVATPPPSTDAPRESLGENDSSGRRHVSGPGQFTPRALLKNEEEFIDVGIDAFQLLLVRGDDLAWLVAEFIVRLAQYLEHASEGKPKSLQARPTILPKTRDGKEVQHCCDEGGITHLLPCNLKTAPPAKQAFGFAGAKRHALVSEHHASKGGVNTIAYVGELVLDLLIGESKIPEAEFKLFAGSEHLRNFLKKGEKRYKSSDPKVDPTKQPILFLKSLKRMAQNSDLVEALKLKYGWALAEYQHLVGERSPEPVTPSEPSPVPAFAQRAATSTPVVNLAPALTPAPASATTKKTRIDTSTPTVAKRTSLKRSYDQTFNEPALAVNDARLSRRPQFPLRELSEEESKRLTKAIGKIETLIDDIIDPMKVINSMAPPPPPVKPAPKMSSPVRKSGRSRKKSSRSSDPISILLNATAVDFDDEQDVATASSIPESRLPEPIKADFVLPVSANFDGYIRTLIEIVVNNILSQYPDDLRYSFKVKEVVDNRRGQLEQVVSDVDFRINTVISVECGHAITDLYPYLHDKVPRPTLAPRSKRSAPGSPTGQLTGESAMNVD